MISYIYGSLYPIFRLFFGFQLNFIIRFSVLIMVIFQFSVSKSAAFRFQLNIQIRFSVLKRLFFRFSVLKRVVFRFSPPPHLLTLSPSYRSLYINIKILSLHHECLVLKFLKISKNKEKKY